MAITRRSFLAGLGAVSVGLLFRRRLDAVLDSLAQEFIDEPLVPDQAPSAVEIVICPQVGFRPQRLVVSPACAQVFALEDVIINARPQFVSSSPGELFSAASLSDSMLTFGAAPVGSEIRFRVRYVGTDPRGARFTAALLGKTLDGGSMQVLPIDSGVLIVG